MEPHLRRIDFVTRHYHDLRGGITRAAIAPIVIVAGVTGRLAGESLAILLALGFAVVAISLLLDRWMDSRFGRMVPGALYQRRVTALVLLVCVAAVRVDHISAGAGPSMLFVALAAYGLWRTVRLWPYGTLNLLPTLAAAAAAIDFASVNSPEARAAWEARAYTSVLVAWTIAGLFDLGLLMKLLPTRGGAHALGRR